MRDLLVMLPVRDRPEAAQRFASAFLATRRGDTALVALVDDDQERLYSSLTADRLVLPRAPLAAKLNHAAAQYAGSFRGLFFLADDTVPRSEGWDVAVSGALASPGIAIAYPNQLTPAPGMAHVAIRSSVVTALGWFALPTLSHYFIDNVWQSFHDALGCARYLEDVVVENMHYSFGRSPYDGLYRETENRYFGTDQQGFEHWRRQQMAADAAVVRQVLGEELPVRTFEDDYQDRITGAWHDIQGHLPELREAAASRPGAVVAELGVRGGNSTAALLAGAGASGGSVWSVDVEDPFVPLWWHESPSWHLLVADDGSPEAQDFLPAEVDVLFVDTSHTYAQTLAELEAYGGRVRPGGVIFCHDTQYAAVHPVSGQPDADLGAPDGEVARALDDYCKKHELLWENRPGFYGLGVVQVPAARKKSAAR